MIHVKRPTDHIETHSAHRFCFGDGKVLYETPEVMYFYLGFLGARRSKIGVHVPKTVQVHERFQKLLDHLDPRRVDGNTFANKTIA